MAYKIFKGQRKDKGFKEGQLVGQKIIKGKEGRYAIKLYYYKDGYRIYAWKELKNGNVIESKATDYPISNYQEALKNLDDYKDESDILLVHSALRNK